MVQPTALGASPPPGFTEDITKDVLPSAPLSGQPRTGGMSAPPPGFTEDITESYSAPTGQGMAAPPPGFTEDITGAQAAPEKKGGMGRAVVDRIYAIGAGIVEGGRQVGEELGDWLGENIGNAGNIVIDDKGIRWEPADYSKDNLPQLTAARDAIRSERKELGYEPTVNWQDVKADPTNVGTFILEHGAASLPDMAAMLISMPTYVLGRTAEIAEERATNKGMKEPTIKEMVEAAPTAMAVAALDRFGLGRIFATFKSKGAILKEIFKTAGIEGSTEAIQEGAEYIGARYGTDAKMEFLEAVDQMAAAAVVGTAMGGAFGGAGATVAKATGVGADPDVMQAPAAHAAVGDQEPPPEGTVPPAGEPPVEVVQEGAAVAPVTAEAATAPPAGVVAHVKEKIEEAYGPISDEEAAQIAQVMAENPGMSAVEAADLAPALTQPLQQRIAPQTERDVVFDELAQQQRDRPELAMTQLQEIAGGGVVSYLAEHVGDLTHRMAQKPGFFRGGHEWVSEKVDKTLRTLESEYGIQREAEENLRRNAEFRGIPFEEQVGKTNEALAKYANEHRKLKVFNEPQRFARDAAVALGEKDFAGAIRNLRALKALTDDRKAYEEAALAYDPDFEATRAKSLGMADFIRSNPEGFTVRTNGEDIPSSGYVVAPLKSAEIVVDKDELSLDVVRRLYDHVDALQKVSNRDVYAGGWLNPEDNKYYLDATHIFEDRAEALYTAKAGKQEAIFDLGEFDAIFTDEGLAELEAAGLHQADALDVARAKNAQLARRFKQERAKGKPRRARKSDKRGKGEEGLTKPLQQSVSLRTGRESLKKYGVEKGKVYKTREVYAALETRQREKYGVIEKGDYSLGAVRKIAGWIVAEVKHELKNPEKSGVGWYTWKFKRALDNFGRMFPELTNLKAFEGSNLPGLQMLGTPEAARNLFTVLLAVTSDGQKVYNNFQFAQAAYEYFRETGQIPLDKQTFPRAAIRNNLKRINELLNEYGPVGMHKYLLEEATVRELQARAKARGEKVSTGFGVDAVLPVSALEFGPKLGSFYANLMGSHGYLTMDLWWSRTINRMRGNVLTSPKKGYRKHKGKMEPVGLTRIAQLLNKPKATDEELILLTIPYVQSYAEKGYKNGTEIEKAANTVYKDAFENLEDQPFGAQDREFMLKAALEAQKRLSKAGHDLTVADIQAIMWYYEKRLAGELGARKSPDISYEEVSKRVVDDALGTSDRPTGQPVGGLGKDTIEGPDGNSFRVRGKDQTPAGLKKKLQSAEIPGPLGSRKLQKAIDEAQEEIRELAARLTPQVKKVELELRDPNDPAGTRPGTFGQYVPPDDIIQVAVGYTDSGHTFSHEAIHHLREQGLIRPDEWAVLVERARNHWREKFHIDENYAHYDAMFTDKALLESLKNEEAIAEAFAYWSTDRRREPSGIKRIFQRVMDYLAGLEMILRGHGIETYGDIFRRIEAGKVGRRQKKPLTIRDRVEQHTGQKKIMEATLQEPLQSQKKGDAEQEAAAKRTYANYDDPDLPLPQRAWRWVNLMAAELQQNFIQSMVDFARPLKTMDTSGRHRAWKAVHLTQHLPQVMASLLHHGMIKYDPRARWFDLDDNPEFKGGFTAMFEPIAKEGLVKLWGHYATAVRANRLTGEAKENLMPQADIDAFLRLGQQYPEFEPIRQKWIKFNKALLDAAEESGLIGRDERAIWEKDDYIPFYRVLETEGAADRRIGPLGEGFSRRKLRGGKDKLGDPLENMVLNMTHIVDQMYQNRAKTEIVSWLHSEGLAGPSDADVIEEIKPDWKVVHVSASEARRALKNQLGVEADRLSLQNRDAYLKLFTRVPPKAPDVFQTFENGKPRYWKVKDPEIMTTIAHIGPQRMHAIWKLLGIPRRMLTEAVTSMPSYMIANGIRDSIQTWVVTDSNIVPFVDTFKGARKALMRDKEVIRIMAAGGGSAAYYSHAPKDVRAQLQEGATPIEPRNVLNSASKAYQNWRRLGESLENANRVAVYLDQMKKGETNMEAAFQAMDVLNFGSRGSSNLALVMRTMIPFWNARVQGLYRLGRGGVDNGKISKKFMIRGSMIAGISLLNMAINWDDDRYDSLPDWERHTYYHVFMDNIFPKDVLKGLGIDAKDWHIRIPKPFEVGAIFSTLPEEMIRIHRKDVSTKEMLKNLMSVMQDQLNLVDYPQAIKPLLELTNNRNQFTGGPIVPQRIGDLLAEAQYTGRTSEVAKEVGGFFGVSPVMLDHAMRAYLGNLGTYIMGASNSMIRELRDAPEPASWSADQIPEMGRFVRNHPLRSTRFLQEFYEMKNEVQAVHRTFRKYREEGRRDDARKLKEEKREALRAYKRVMNEAERISKINKRINTVESHKSWSGDVKRSRLKRLYNQRNRLAERIVKRLGNHF